MKDFINKTVRFLMLLPVIYLFYYYSIDYYYNCRKNNNAIFIWGDSQTYQGVDLQVLGEKTNRKVFSYAKHGAGVYDFLVFSEKVPSYSVVVLGVSKLVQLRKKRNDRNKSGISIVALYNLYQNGYSMEELIKIMKENKYPSKIVSEKTNLYMYNEKIVLNCSIDVFKNIYSGGIPSYLSDKQALYKIGIRKLRDKGCSIIFVDFPYHIMVKEIEENSIVKDKTNELIKYIIKTSRQIEIDTLTFDTKIQIMHDLTHLNEIGAKLVSNRISEIIEKHNYITKTQSNKYTNRSYEVYLKVLSQGMLEKP